MFRRVEMQLSSSNDLLKRFSALRNDHRSCLLPVLLNVTKSFRSLCNLRDILDMGRHFDSPITRLHGGIKINVYIRWKIHKLVAGTETCTVRFHDDMSYPSEDTVE
jgi:hypothetical protein